MKLRSLFILILSISVFPACGGLSKRIHPDPFHLGMQSPGDSSAALPLIEKIKNVNAGLSTYKGVGSLEIRRDDLSLKSRMVWIGDSPERIRLEILGIHGQPISSFSSDGEWIYFLSHLEKKFHKRRLKDNSLEQLLKIPLPLSTVSELLMGRIPISEFSAATLVTKGPDGGSILYVLEKETGNIEKIYLNPDHIRAGLIEFLNPEGILLYRIMLDDTTLVNAYDIPFFLSVADEKGAGLTIKVDRFWVDVDIDPVVFVLKGPG